MTNAPFVGLVEFKLSFRAFDERVVRKAQATYSYTPSWPYYDCCTRNEREGKPRLELGLVLLAVPRADRHRPGLSNTPYWVPVGQLLAPGVLRTRIYDHLQKIVDTDAMEADRRNRVRAGLSVPPPPECI